MADKISHFEEFKEMLTKENIAFIELDMQTLIVKSKSNDSINIRLYHDNYCLSSWIDIEKFRSGVKELIV